MKFLLVDTVVVEKHEAVSNKSGHIFTLYLGLLKKFGKKKNPAQKNTPPSGKPSCPPYTTTNSFGLEKNTKNTTKVLLGG